MSLGTSGSDGEVHVDTFTSSGSLMSATVRATSITPCHTPAKANPTSCGAFPSSQPRPLATQIRGSSLTPAAANSALKSS
jgi:hypothetical protein